MATPLKSIGLVLVCTLLIACAQVLYKFGVDDLDLKKPLSVLTNYFILGGLALYGLGALLLVVALKWGELSVLYPIIATGYVWVSLLSMHFFKETMNSWKWLGVASIVLGVSMIGFGSKKKT